MVRKLSKNDRLNTMCLKKTASALPNVLKTWRSPVMTKFTFAKSAIVKTNEATAKLTTALMLFAVTSPSQIRKRAVKPGKSPQNSSA